MQEQDTAGDHRDGGDLDHAHGFAEQERCDDGEQGGADAGPDRVGDAQFDAGLECAGEGGVGDDVQQRRDDRESDAGQAVGEAQHRRGDHLGDDRSGQEHPARHRGAIGAGAADAAMTSVVRINAVAADRFRSLLMPDPFVRCGVGRG
nr:hypothetical protein [Actinoplanes sp. ATCC 53533]